jgi:hypothetical protein
MTALTVTSHRLASLARRHTRAALGGSVLGCIALAELAAALVTHATV